MNARRVVLLIVFALLAACGPSQADHEAAVATQVALLIEEQGGVSEPVPAPEATSGPAATDDPDFPIPGQAACTPDNTARVVGTVEEVWSGDSIGVRIDGALIEVRYIGIDGDDNDQALQANRQLVEGKQVLLITDETDRDEFGRMLRYVIADGLFVNLELVKQGVAFPSPEEPDLACDTILADAVP